MAQDYTNDYSSTLSSGYSSGGTSLVLASVSGLPTSGRVFYLRVSSELTNTAEYFKCTSYSGTTLTVVGAQQGSSASNHSSGAVITGCWWLPAVIDGVRADQSQVGTYSGLPASGMKKGDSYQCTDGPFNFIYDGSVWQAFFMGIPVKIPPSGSWTWANQGSSTVTGVGPGLHMSLALNGSDLGRGYLQATPGATYTIIIGVQALPTSGGEAKPGALGIALWDSSSTKLVAFFCGNDGKLHCFEFSATSYAFNAREWSDIAYGFGGIYWMKIVEDGTHRTFFTSVDGVVWSQIQQVSAATYITPTHIGVGVDVSGSYNSDGLLFYFSLTSP